MACPVLAAASKAAAPAAAAVVTSSPGIGPVLLLFSCTARGELGKLLLRKGSL